MEKYGKWLTSLLRNYWERGGNRSGRGEGQCLKRGGDGFKNGFEVGDGHGRYD